MAGILQRPERTAGWDLKRHTEPTPALPLPAGRPRSDGGFPNHMLIGGSWEPWGRDRRGNLAVGNGPTAQFVASALVGPLGYVMARDQVEATI